jgi:predicted Zn-ribbon and HTH transcriptional regulator
MDKNKTAQTPRNKVSYKMIAEARKRYPNCIHFDFVECNSCGFVGLVGKGVEVCPNCKDDCLQWADEDNQEVNL